MGYWFYSNSPVRNVGTTIGTYSGAGEIVRG